MAIMDVVLYPDDPLTQKATPIEDFDQALERLVTDMAETMDTYDGVGLAGPQVGVSRRLLVMRAPGAEAITCLINPEIIASEGAETAEEGCLSLPNLYVEISRATRIKVRAQDIHGRQETFEAEDMHARIIQHEVDHLGGIVILDRLDFLTREAKMREWNEIRQHLAAGA
ncbi:MAG: peptide deformylase [Candidatus Hydrogenedentota bacterium]